MNVTSRQPMRWWLSALSITAMVFTLDGHAQEIEVRGNDHYVTNTGSGFVVIADGDTSPSTSDHTDFRTVDRYGPGETRTFTIVNTGTANLTISTPTISGTNAADFSITGMPASTVAPGKWTTVSVLFKPQGTGTRNATLNIGNNDSNENPYNFSIRGTGQVVSGTYTKDFAADASGWTFEPVGTMWGWHSGGYLYHNKANPTDAVGRVMYSGTNGTWDTDYTYSLRMMGEQSSTTSTFRKVGAVYNYVNSSNYYELLVTPDGDAAELRKKVGGTESSVATTTLTSKGVSLATDVWFDVMIIREGEFTTVKINNKIVFHRVSGQTLGAGKVGVTDRTNFSRFDDVVVRATPFKSQFPRLGGYLIGGNKAAGGVKDYEDATYQAAIAKLDLAVIGFFPGWNRGTGATPAARRKAVIDAIKDINPNIILGNYTLTPNVSITSDAYIPMRNKLASGTISGTASWTPADWWAHTTTGANIAWDGWVTNITNYVNPDSNGDRYSQWAAKYFHTEFFNPPSEPVPDFDLWYVDNVFYRPRWAADWNRDGVVDGIDDQSVRTAYRTGMRTHWDKISSLRSDLIVMGNIDGKGGNGGLRDPEYQYRIAGALWEGAIGKDYSEEDEAGKGWYGTMQSYRSMINNTVWPHLVMFCVAGELDGSADDNGPNGYQRFRYGFASALMEDGYYYYEDASDGYHGVMWFDEYDKGGADTNTSWLGEAIDPPQRTAWSNGVFRRRFDNGCALVNPRHNIDGTARSAVTVDLTGQGYKRISGTQVPSVNNGANVTTITLQPGDGIVLQRQ